MVWGYINESGFLGAIFKQNVIQIVKPDYEKTNTKREYVFKLSKSCYSLLKELMNYYFKLNVHDLQPNSTEMKKDVRIIVHHVPCSTSWADQCKWIQRAALKQVKRKTQAETAAPGSQRPTTGSNQEKFDLRRPSGPTPNSITWK